MEWILTYVINPQDAQKIRILTARESGIWVGQPKSLEIISTIIAV